MYLWWDTTEQTYGVMVRYHNDKTTSSCGIDTIIILLQSHYIITGCPDIRKPNMAFLYFFFRIQFSLNYEIKLYNERRFWSQTQLVICHLMLTNALELRLIAWTHCGVVTPHSAIELGQVPDGTKPLPDQCSPITCCLASRGHRPLKPVSILSGQNQCWLIIRRSCDIYLRTIYFTGNNEDISPP